MVMEKLSVVLGAVVIGIVGLVFLSFLLSWPVYMLWNGCLVGAIDGIKEVTWMQAWGINILAGFLFKTTTSSK
jgi:sterol desaturase/sphingolipid hydroxylase (fatty acid hydroxylase superfamily)